MPVHLLIILHSLLSYSVHFVASTKEEDFGLIRPSLIRQLRAILDQYPDDGQILKVRSIFIKVRGNEKNAGKVTEKRAAGKRENPVLVLGTVIIT